LDKQYKTEQLCLLAVKQDGYMLQFVDSDIQTVEMCYFAIKSNPDTYRYAKYHLSEISKFVPATQPNDQLCDKLNKIHKELRSIINRFDYEKLDAITNKLAIIIGELA
jgi:hypothetical protein